MFFIDEIKCHLKVLEKYLAVIERFLALTGDECRIYNAQGLFLFEVEIFNSYWEQKDYNDDAFNTRKDRVEIIESQFIFSWNKRLFVQFLSSQEAYRKIIQIRRLFHLFSHRWTHKYESHVDGIRKCQHNEKRDEFNFITVLMMLNDNGNYVNSWKTFVQTLLKEI